MAELARALRAFLRQDPDIIMVGEIRDRETAEIAINASLPGHMVFSTLHTNVRRENATQIRNLLLAKGMKTLREDGWAKVFKGVTSVKEILRVTEEQ